MAKAIRVLVGCECSGVVRDAFRAVGADAWSCDLQPDIQDSPYHLQRDVLQVIDEGQWDLLIAHPPCTYLCNSGAGRMHHIPPNPSPGVPYGPARWQAMCRAAKFFRTLLNAKVPHVALENPVMHGSAYAAIGGHKPTQTIQPWQFGDDASKRTGLWLRRLPKLRPLPESQFASPRLVWNNAKGDYVYRWGNQTDSGQNALTPSADRAQIRSTTYPGIARAMAEQWTEYILSL